MPTSSSIFLAAIALALLSVCVVTHLFNNPLGLLFIFSTAVSLKHASSFLLSSSLKCNFSLKLYANHFRDHTNSERLVGTKGRSDQTLTDIAKIHSIVVEDSEKKTERVIDVLNASRLSHTHLAVRSNNHFNGRGFEQRNAGLSYIHQKYGNSSDVCGVVYFADDDNSYDVRLFNNYIRHVKRVGVWAVGFAGGQKVLSPFEVHGLNSSSPVDRNFSADMAEFAVNLHLILSTGASFIRDCPVGRGETCFLEQLNVSWEQLEPFGFDEETKQVFVWHTRTGNSGSGGDTMGYVV